MDGRLYVAASGMVARQRQLDLIANNLANASTLGYRREDTLFREMVRGAGPRGRAGGAVPRSQVALDTSFTVEESGPLKVTEGPLDLALRGDGFFAVRTNRGVSYTRAGSFSLDATGRLVSSAGDPVLDDGRNEILLPPGELEIQADGSLLVNESLVGKVGVFDLPQESRTRSGGSLLSPVPGFDPKPLDAPEILPGHLETSNVNAVLELSRMVESQRAFAAYERLIHLTMNVVNRAIIDLGQPR